MPRRSFCSREVLFGALLSLLLLAAARPAAAQTTVPWQALPNSALNLHLPSPLVLPGSSGPGAIVAGWNSAAFDTTRNRLVIPAAGGHGDYGGNEVYVFDHATEQFIRLTNPSTAAPGWPGQSVDVLSDGTPPTVHTYGGVGYSPSEDVVYRC